MKPEYPQRPPRLKTVFFGYAPVFFVTFNTYQQVRILASPEVRHAFVDFCNQAGKHGVSVGYYAIMPDHIHLFVWCDLDRSSLCKWVKALKCYLSKTLIQMNISKPHWQEGFFDHLLRHGESYREKSHYVLMNPVRAGLCAQPGEWPYSGKIADLSM